jgi:hypothetical protein
MSKSKFFKAKKEVQAASNPTLAQPEVENITTFSTMDFFDRFARAASEKGLLKTPLTTPISKSHIRAAAIQLLQAARLHDLDVKILDDNYGGTIMITKQGLGQVLRYLAYTQEYKAAILIQKCYRGYLCRKKMSSKLDNLLYLVQYISDISVIYHSILNAHRSSTIMDTPSQSEIEFMRQLNHAETYSVCKDYLLLLARVQEAQLFKQRMTMLPDYSALQNTMVMYQEYAPKLLDW